MCCRVMGVEGGIKRVNKERIFSSDRSSQVQSRTLEGTAWPGLHCVSRKTEMFPFVQSWEPAVYPSSRTLTVVLRLPGKHPPSAASSPCTLLETKMLFSEDAPKSQVSLRSSHWYSPLKMPDPQFVWHSRPYLWLLPSPPSCLPPFT